MSHCEPESTGTVTKATIATKLCPRLRPGTHVTPLPSNPNHSLLSSLPTPFSPPTILLSIRCGLRAISCSGKRKGRKHPWSFCSPSHWHSQQPALSSSSKITTSTQQSSRFKRGDGTGPQSSRMHVFFSFCLFMCLEFAE